MLGAATMAVASTALVAVPARAASAGLAAAGVSTVSFRALMGQINDVSITISGSVRNGEGFHPPHELSVNAQGFAAGGKDPQVRARGKERVSKPGRRLDQVLAVVEHKEQPLLAQVIDEGFG